VARQEQVEPHSQGVWTALGLLGRVVVGLAFLVSGYSKAVAPPQEFAAVIETYQIVPGAWSVPMATVLPWIELFLGAFVLTGYYRRKSAVGVGAMLCAFVWALVTAQLRGIELDSCGCFGRLIEFKPWQATLLDVTMSGLCFAVWKDSRGPFSLDGWIEGSPPSRAKKADRATAVH
jgi:uncharacterized membrane protein YphA (DoxX/SURF4 family)